MEDEKVVEGGDPRLGIEGDQSRTRPTISGSGYAMVAILLYIVAVGLAIGGFVNAYFDSGYPHAIVGGDAFNYIIFATRGAVWMGGAIVSAIIALGFQVAGHAVDFWYRESGHSA